MFNVTSRLMSYLLPDQDPAGQAQPEEAAPHQLPSDAPALQAQPDEVDPQQSPPATPVLLPHQALPITNEDIMRIFRITRRDGDSVGPADSAFAKTENAGDAIENYISQGLWNKVNTLLKTRQATADEVLKITNNLLQPGSEQNLAQLLELCATANNSRYTAHLVEHYALSGNAQMVEACLYPAGVNFDVAVMHPVFNILQRDKMPEAERLTALKMIVEACEGRLKPQPDLINMMTLATPTYLRLIHAAGLPVCADQIEHALSRFGDKDYLRETTEILRSMRNNNIQEMQNELN